MNRYSHLSKFSTIELLCYNYYKLLTLLLINIKDTPLHNLSQPTELPRVAPG